ncbi:hypothetical protein CRV01_12730 [Arcobacter sp. CECT 8983]|uniref:hypothetical protein n=1 Tax=Arcobacter sp. CECT 8983 TaxID=2044508 RepID=UPI00100C0E8D|nr:hypothetical protein [Arcobacter sp. CECT 8983]RXJ88426.1 hypothetical protein CRV01_12730 [Arcobacter sp. CECT 8983]
MFKLVISILILQNLLIAINKEYCIAKTNIERVIGLTKFNNKKEFIKKCNGKMIFIYKDNKCRFFTMKNMKFDIFIKDRNNTSLFKINERKKVCGKEIIEYVNK